MDAAHKTTPQYQQQDSPQTLREGLAEYYARMQNLIPLEAMRPEARALFVLHDTAHVVFGCDTSLGDEVLLDVWTLFGSDIAMRTYLNYMRLPEVAGIFRENGYLRSLWVACTMLPRGLRIIARTRAMRRRWPWREHERYLAMPLRELRAELGISLLPA